MFFEMEDSPHGRVRAVCFQMDGNHAALSFGGASHQMRRRSCADGGALCPCIHRQAVLSFTAQMAVISLTAAVRVTPCCCRCLVNCSGVMVVGG